MSNEPNPDIDDTADTDAENDDRYSSSELAPARTRTPDDDLSFTCWDTRDGREYQLASKSNDQQWIRAVNTARETSVVALDQWE